MKKVLNINAVSEYNDLTDRQTRHPLVSVIDFSKSNPKKARWAVYELRAVRHIFKIWQTL